MSKRNREKRSVPVGTARGKKTPPAQYDVSKQKSKNPEATDTVGENFELITSAILDLFVAFLHMTTVL